jgi:hypothetical protein
MKPMKCRWASARRCRITIASLLAVTTSFAFVRDAAADDLFEIQVFHVRVDEPGQVGAELHSNYVLSGVARESPELSPNHVLYEMVEPTWGFAKGWELGAHIQTAVRPSGVEWGGNKLRIMAIVPTASTFPIRFAANFEGGYDPPAYDPGKSALEIRPIAEMRLGPFDFDLNPVLATNGEGARAGVPRLEPSGAVRFALLHTVDLSVEYYAALGPLNGFLPLDKQSHTIFEAVDLVRWPHWVVRAGIGEGLTESSNGIIFTTMLGHFL